MEDNFNVHKWNRDRYIREVSEEPYGTAMNVLAKKLGIKGSEGTNKFRVSYIVNNEIDDEVEVKASNDLDAIDKAIRDHALFWSQDTKMIVTNTLTKEKTTFQYNPNTNQYEKI